MIESLLRDLVNLDWVFWKMQRKGIPETACDALREFWRQPRFAKLSAQLQLPQDDWQTTVARLHDLSTGQCETGDYEDWVVAARGSEELSTRDPLAASIVSLYSLAAWEGAAGEGLFWRNTASHTRGWFCGTAAGYLEGWNIFPRILGRNLVAAEAIWGAKTIVAKASGFIESTRLAYFSDEAQAIIADYEKINTAIEQLYAEWVKDLAWDLRANCGPDQPEVRAAIAALFWTLGDIPHASLIASDGTVPYRPLASLMRSLVDQSMQRIPYEPFIQYIWLEMKNLASYNLRRHKGLFYRIDNVYQNNELHFFERQALSGLVPSPSKAYVTGVVNYYKNEISDDDRENLGTAYSVFGQLLLSTHPLSYIRLLALINLILSSEEVRGERWEQLATQSALILEKVSRDGIFEPYERGLEAPFYYLEPDSSESMVRALELLDRYRCGGLWYWLTVNPPEANPSIPQHLIEKETEILTRLRSARFINLLPYLPVHYQRHDKMETLASSMQRLDKAAGSGEAGASEVNPFDQDVALQALRQTTEELATYWKNLAPLAPDYVAKRQDPHVTVAEFARALRVQ